MKRFVYLLTLLTLSFPLFAQDIQNPEFEQAVKDILSFSVPNISCEDLNADYDEYLILDARTAEEYKVSHLKGAKRVGYDDFSVKSLKGIDKSTKIVIYCSVGYRSEKIGERLMRMGYSNVLNLYGSIFEWNNQAYPLYKGKKKTTKIHAVDADWAKWVKQGEKVF
jgi:rhodanese-related sulfurtransferase